MTPDQILDQRAELYANALADQGPQGQARCLGVTLGARQWLFPESEIAALLPATRTVELPAGVGWGGWPCFGLLSHSLSILPLFCWAALTGSAPPGSECSILVVRSLPVAIRVPDPVGMLEADLSNLTFDGHPWSLGKTSHGIAVAKLSRLGQEGA